MRRAGPLLFSQEQGSRHKALLWRLVAVYCCWDTQSSCGHRALIESRPTTLISHLKTSSHPGFLSLLTVPLSTSSPRLATSVVIFHPSHKTNVAPPQGHSQALSLGFPWESGWDPYGAASLSLEFSLILLTRFVFSPLMLNFQFTILLTLP